MSVPGWLRHAFSVDDGPLQPTPEQAALIDRLCREVVRRGMAVPVLAFLEMSQPLNYVAAQTITFFSPMISSLFDSRGHEAFAEFLEHRGSVEHLCREIERILAERPEPEAGHPLGPPGEDLP